MDPLFTIYARLNIILIELTYRVIITLVGDRIHEHYLTYIPGYLQWKSHRSWADKVIQGYICLFEMIAMTCVKDLRYLISVRCSLDGCWLEQTEIKHPLEQTSNACPYPNGLHVYNSPHHTSTFSIHQYTLFQSLWARKYQKCLEVVVMATHYIHILRRCRGCLHKE